MDDIRISTAQFENRSGDKKYNLWVIDRLAAEAAAKGADVVAFHECSRMFGNRVYFCKTP